MRKSKAQQFNISIRRKARDKIFQDFRLKLNYDCVPIEQVALTMGLPFREPQYTIREIMEQCRGDLVNSFSWLIKLNKNMQEENGERQHVQKTVCVGQTNFWGFLVKQLYDENLKPDLKIMQFFEDFLDNNQYKFLAYNKKYQTKIINAFELIACSPLANQLFKEKILAWVTGTDGLTLLNNAMINDFLDPSKFKNFYEVIGLGFKLYDFTQLKNCCELLIQCFGKADADDLFAYYEQYGHVMTQLLSKAEFYLDEKNGAKDISCFADAVLVLMNSYNSLVLDYSRMGTVLLAVKMVSSINQENCVKGLEILNLCAQVDKREMIEFLVEDQELQQQNLWSFILKTKKVFYSNNINVRRLGFSILANIMAHGHSEHTVGICNNFDIEDEDFLQFLKRTLELQADAQIIENVLCIISVILYYGRVMQEENDGENLALKKMVDNGFPKLIDKLISHPNQNISIKATQLMEGFQESIN